MTAPASPPRTPREPSIVGIGASAGGLAALEAFFSKAVPGAGLAFVVVQHLDPTHKAVLAELLQRATPMPVLEAADGLRLQADHVYVIPSNAELSVGGGLLHLHAPGEPRGLRLPINILFSSLAREQGRRAIAVVLSGMGTDGTLGLRAIKAAGGLTLAQSPASAQFDSMPLSAIDSGCTDIVAEPGELPARIAELVAREAAAVAADPLHGIFELLQQRTRHDFSPYKPSTLHRRIERRMAIHDIAELSDYADLLRHNPQEIDLLFKELLIGVTRFFRDTPVWQTLLETALPALMSKRTPGVPLRAWVVGCSTGEEAYSLAMVLTETLERLPSGKGWPLQIFASDLSPDAIDTARAGQYGGAIVDDVSPDRLARFFVAHDGVYRVAKSLRDCVLFALHDVVLDPPFTRLDLLSCRNLMIYFDAALQRRLLPLFHYSLRPGGLLLLGGSETIGRFQRLFEPLDAKLRLYQRMEGLAGGGRDFLATSFPPLSRIFQEPALPRPIPSASSADSLQIAADQILLQVHAPPAVVVSAAGDIVYISGRTGKFLEPAAGKANLNFHAMMRDGLRQPVAQALELAASQGETQTLRGLRVPLSEGTQRVDVTVQALQEPAALQGMFMIVFREVAAPPAPGRGRKGGSAAALAHASEVQQLRDEIQTLHEEARATREELQSANEELQSTNEELQSTNEELTTSKEEMQSMNEELQTVNAEMQTKLDDLALAQGDMKNLLNSTDIAILFLDQTLNVRRYTDRAAKIISLRESDIGRPFSDLATSLRYPALREDAEETLRTLAVTEKQIQASDERWFSVRILPYRTLDNRIDGAVITFVDISATKRLEARLRKPA